MLNRGLCFVHVVPPGIVRRGAQGHKELETRSMFNEIST